MNSFGYTGPWRPSMIVTGIGTIVGAPAGGHAINLAAISAALAGWIATLWLGRIATG